MVLRHRDIEERAAAKVGDLPEFFEVIDKIGLGASQLRALMLGSISWFVAGSFTVFVSIVVAQLDKEKLFLAEERVRLFSVAFAGLAVGNGASAFCMNTFGHRLTILLSLLVYALVCFLGSAVNSHSAVCILLFFLGFGSGIGEPVGLVYCCEILPSPWRVLSSACSMGSLIMGETFVVLMVLGGDDQGFASIHWHALMVLFAVPAMFSFWVASVALRESPSFLAMVGQNDEARSILRLMCSEHGVVLPKEADFRTRTPQDRNEVDHVIALFSGELCGVTLMLMLANLAINLAYFGTHYVVPIAMRTSNSSVLLAFDGSGLGIFGVCLGTLFGLCLPRTQSIRVTFSAFIFSILVFSVGLIGGYNMPWYPAWAATPFLRFGLFSIKSCGFCAWVLLYTYMVEVYPTPLRATAVSFLTLAGRFSCFIAPVIAEFLRRLTGLYLFNLPIYAMLLFLCILSVNKCGQEASHTLQDHNGVEAK